MDDFIKDCQEAVEGVISRTLKFNGKTGDVYFKRISDAQRSDLLNGQVIDSVVGEKATVKINLAHNAESHAKLVLYSSVNSDGSQRFKKLSEVRAMDAALVNALYLLADDVNKEDLRGGDDPGKD